MTKGLILKGVGGEYSVKTQGDMYICEIRGSIKYSDDRPIVGDFVLIEIIDEKLKKGMIKEILPRKTKLHRPLVSNVSQAIIVFSIKDPDPHLNLLDRLLVFVEHSGLNSIICFNKSDIDDFKIVDDYRKIYEDAGYKVIVTSATENLGRAELIEILKNEISVFAGPSGVGKSSLLNMIQPNLKLRIGEISKKIRRGKHTTRHTELIPLDSGGWVVDTPGFANLDISFIDKSDVGDYFKEIKAVSSMCKFKNCLHINEPKCAVIKKLSEKGISKSRYKSYLLILNEIEKNRRY
jgi:ribosome biogenesis GTPase